MEGIINLEKFNVIYKVLFDLMTNQLLVKDAEGLSKSIYTAVLRCLPFKKSIHVSEVAHSHYSAFTSMRGKQPSDNSEGWMWPGPGILLSFIHLYNLKNN